MAAARPVVLLSGWPLDSRSWEPQVHALLRGRPSRDRCMTGAGSASPAGRPRATTSTHSPGPHKRADRRSTCVTSPWSASRSVPGSWRATSAPTGPTGCGPACSSRASRRRSPNPPRTRMGPTRRGSTPSARRSLDDRFEWLTGLLGDFSISTITSASGSARRRSALPGTPPPARRRSRRGRAHQAGSRTFTRTSNGSTCRR